MAKRRRRKKVRALKVTKAKMKALGFFTDAASSCGRGFERRRVCKGPGKKFTLVASSASCPKGTKDNNQFKCRIAKGFRRKEPEGPRGTNRGRPLRRKSQFSRGLAPTPGGFAKTAKKKKKKG